MHNLVPFPQDKGRKHQFPFPLFGRIQNRLKPAVQGHGSGLVFSGGTKHLNIADGRIAVSLGQANRDQFFHLLRHLAGIVAGQKEKIGIPQRQIRKLTDVNLMRIGHDCALHRLTEHRVQFHRRDTARFHQIMQNVPCPHARQLIRVADQDQAAAQGQRLQQPIKKKRVDHGHLVDDQQVAGQRVMKIPAKDGAAVFIQFRLQKAVNSLGFVAGDLAHAFGRPAGRCGQENR